MSDTIKPDKKENMLRKKRYYYEHPNEAVPDHIKQIETGSDDFIMEKVKRREKEQHRLKELD